MKKVLIKKDSALTFLIIVLIIHIFYLAPGNAQEVLSRADLTISQAIEIGLAESPLVKSGEFQLESSQAQMRVARSGLYPRIDISQAFKRTTNPMWAFGTKLNQEVITREDFDPNKLNDPDPINNFATVFSVVLPVYNRGETRIGISQASLGHRIAQLNLKRARQTVIMEITRAYYGVLLAEKNLAVIQEALRTAKAHFKVARDRYEAGLVVKSDFLRSKVHVAMLERQRLQAESQLRIAFSRLSVAMGQEAGRSFHLVTPLTRGESIKGTLEQWVLRAVQNRPDLKQMELKKEIVKKEVDKAKSEYMPGLYLSGNYEINSEDFTETANNYSVGAVLQFNLFSGFHTKSRVEKARYDLNTICELIRRLKLNVQVETRKAFLDAQSCWEQIDVAASAIDQAEEALRIIRDRYETGLFTMVQLLDAETALEESRLNYFRSIHDYRVAMANLGFAAGINDTMLSSRKPKE